MKSLKKESKRVSLLFQKQMRMQHGGSRRASMQDRSGRLILILLRPGILHQITDNS